MQNHIFDLISFIGAVQGVLLSVFLFSRASNQRSTFFLASYVLFFSVGLLEPWADRTLTGEARLAAVSFLSSSNYLYGPLLYLFVYHFVGRPRLALKKYLLHSVPFAAIFPVAATLSLSQAEADIQDLFLFVAFEGLVIQILTYNVKAIGLLKKNEPLSPSGKSGSNITWLRSLFKFITIIYGLSFLISHLILFGWAEAQQLYLLVQVSITVMIYLMTYRLIMHPQLFIVRSTIMGDENGNAAKYAKSGLKQAQAEEYVAELNRLMQNEKPYLDPDLSIYSLSKRLNISRNHLTQVINEKLNMNFYEYINGYRIEEAKKMITHPAYAHLNFTGIALESGFKSKTAFNMNFKKFTGCTPSDWKRSAHFAAGNV